MDYESRKVKWYWMLLFIVYCGGVVYLLFQGNPFLYSHLELRSALDVGEAVHRQTIPAKPISPVKLTPSTFERRYSLERAAIDPSNTPHNKNYEEFAKFNIDFGVEGFTPLNVSQDASGLYLTGKSAWVIAVGLDGKVRWKYRFKESEDAPMMLPVLLDENSAYLVHPSGEVVCLDKNSGDIRWIMALKEEVTALPILWHKDILIPGKSATGVPIHMVNRLTGQIEPDSPKLEIKPGFLLSESAVLGQLIATVDNKVLAINPEDWEVEWSQTLTDPIKGPAAVVGNQIYVSTLGAKLVKLDGAKKGKIEWEADLEKPAASAPAYLPVVGRLAVLDNTGALSAIDAKTGKVYWRIPTENRNPLVETWAARLSGKHIEEFKMDWLHKGWSIWSPCSENRFCIYTPNKGQQIAKIALSGHPMTLPLAIGKQWYFLLQQKPGHYTLSHIVEDAEAKKLRSAHGSNE